MLCSSSPDRKLLIELNTQLGTGNLIYLDSGYKIITEMRRQDSMFATSNNHNSKSQSNNVCVSNQRGSSLPNRIIGANTNIIWKTHIKLNDKNTTIF